MRTLHAIHLLAMFALFVIGLHYIREYRRAIAMIEIVGLEEANYGLPSYSFGFISAIFFAATTILGTFTRRKMPKTGGLLTIGGGLFFIWSLIMLSSPRAISIDEIFLFWCLWMLTAIILNGIAFVYIDSAQEPETFFDDDILDDI